SWTVVSSPRILLRPLLREISHLHEQERQRLFSFHRMLFILARYQTGRVPCGSAPTPVQAPVLATPHCMLLALISRAVSRRLRSTCSTRLTIFWASPIPGSISTGRPFQTPPVWS